MAVSTALMDTKIVIKSDKTNLGSYPDIKVSSSLEQFYELGKAINMLQTPKLTKVVKTEEYRLI